jgi:hypothetical protein
MQRLHLHGGAAELIFSFLRSPDKQLLLVAAFFFLMKTGCCRWLVDKRKILVRHDGGPAANLRRQRLRPCLVLKMFLS